jgi:hypothetical protein
MMPLAGRDVHQVTVSANEALTSVDPVHPSTSNGAIEVRPVDPVHHAHIRYERGVELRRYVHHAHSRRTALHQQLGRSTRRLPRDDR